MQRQDETVSNSLQEIAKLRGCNVQTARSFCQQVYEMCIARPAYADIAQAIKQLHPQSYTLYEVAERASTLRGWTNNVKEARPESSFTPGHPASDGSHNTITDDLVKIREQITKMLSPLELNFEQIQANTEAQGSQFLRAVSEETRKQLFAHNVGGLVIGTTGNSPFNSGDLDDLIYKLGGINDQQDIPWGKQTYIVLGRSDYNEEYLYQSVQHSLNTKHITQEEFLNLLLFGVEPDFSNSYRHLVHPGLKFVAEVPDPEPEFTWPEVDTTPTEVSGEEPDVSGWQDEHLLKSKFHYTVDARENLSVTERQKRLQKAIKDPPTGLGLETVARHIAGQILLSKNRPERREAVQKWKNDLDWLYKNHYKPGSKRFHWPVT